MGFVQMYTRCQKCSTVINTHEYIAIDHLTDSADLLVKKHPHSLFVELLRNNAASLVHKRHFRFLNNITEFFFKNNITENKFKIRNTKQLT